MKKNKKILNVLIVILITLTGTISYAHGGKTDSNGGHKDKNNVSGLGPYHYHCGGHPAHLHPDGKCPYSSDSNKSESNTKQSSSSSKKSNISNSSNSNEETKQTIINKEPSKKEIKTEQETKAKAKTKTSKQDKNNTNTNNTNKNADYSNPIPGILALGLLGGGGYVGYKKHIK